MNDHTSSISTLCVEQETNTFLTATAPSIIGEIDQELLVFFNAELIILE